MPNISSNYLLFLAGALVVLVIPGPAVFYIVSRAVGQGRKAGLVSAAGISGGTLIHTTGAGLGLSGILVSSARAFHLVQLAGALYLIFLGVRTLASRDLEQSATASAPHRLSRVFGQGVLVNLLNPKAALSFLRSFHNLWTPRTAISRRKSSCWASRSSCWASRVTAAGHCLRAPLLIDCGGTRAGAALRKESPEVH